VDDADWAVGCECPTAAIRISSNGAAGNSYDLVTSQLNRRLARGDRTRLNDSAQRKAPSFKDEAFQKTCSQYEMFRRTVGPSPYEYREHRPDIPEERI